MKDPATKVNMPAPNAATASTDDANLDHVWEDRLEGRLLADVTETQMWPP